MNSVYRIFKGDGFYVAPDFAVKQVSIERGFAVSGDADEWATDPEEIL